MNKTIIGTTVTILVLATYFSSDFLTAKATTANTADTSAVVSDSYSSTVAAWKASGLTDVHSDSGVVASENFLSNPTFFLTNDNNDYPAFLASSGLDLEGSGEVLEWDAESGYHDVTFLVDVPTTNLYTLALDYYSQTTGIREIEIAVVVNGETQYYEAGQITLDTFWVASNDFQDDRYDNQIMPNATQYYQWTHTYIQDASRIQERPLAFKLNAGMNSIKIQVNNGLFKLGQVYLGPQIVYTGYHDYLSLNGFNALVQGGYQTLEAENPALKNTLSIRYGTDREPNVKPFALIESKLNIVDGDTFRKPGQIIYYDAEVAFTGFYNITVKSRQTNVNTRVFRTLYVDGKVPFLEALTIPFDFNRKWENTTLSDTEGNELAIYLEAGTHRIALGVNASPFRQIHEDIREVMNGVNALSLDIKKLTGNTVDENREWDILTYMPNLQTDLVAYGDKVKDVLTRWTALNATSKASEVSNNLKLAYQMLYQLSEKPNNVPKNIGKLSTSSSSVLNKLGVAMPLVIDAPLSLDSIYINGENAKLPKATAGFFTRLWISIERFFASFFSPQYSIQPSEDELEIWVNRSRQYVNLMQQMVDSQFTPTTGIKVKISIMPNEDKLILATSSGSQPDIAMGVAGWRPYDFAIRNAIYDLTQFSDFQQVASRFYPGSFMQLVYQEGVYGLPETQNFYLMFYRKDIMSNLSLGIPNTWDDVLDILPELQRFGMNFYSQLSGTNAFKGFTSTMPFIMQFGGKIFSDDALHSALDDPHTIEALTFMTDLYTTYNLPLEVGSFFNSFRYGTLPIGIGDFSMYVELLHAAPEIAGLWDIAPIPGVMKNGVVDRSFDGAATSAMIFKNTGKETQSWDFLKWWTSKEIQLQYSENLISSLGSEYMWNTSNVAAFADMSWDPRHKAVFLDQWQWISDTAKTPASYMLEREISNIWNKVVYNSVNVRTAIEDSTIIVEKEIQRKMSEFGFIDSKGNVLKVYLLPTKETIGLWVSLDE